MRAADRVDQLCGDPDATAGLADRAFEHIVDAQFLTDALNVNGLVFVSEAGVTGENKQPFDAAERRDDLFDHAIGEILLLGVAAHIGDGQYRDRRFVGAGSPRAGRDRRRSGNSGGIRNLLPAGIQGAKAELAGELVASSGDGTDQFAVSAKGPAQCCDFAG